MRLFSKPGRTKSHNPRLPPSQCPPTPTCGYPCVCRRTIAKWAARQSRASAPEAVRTPRASALALARPTHAVRNVSAAGDGGGSGGGGCNARCDEDEGVEEESLYDSGDDWTMRVFRARAPGAGDPDRGGGNGRGRRSVARKRDNRRAASDAGAVAPPSPSPGLVVVKALRVPLPLVAPPPTLPPTSGDRAGSSTTATTVDDRGERHAASAQSVAPSGGGEKSAWRRGPLSWLSAGRKVGSAATAAGEPLPSPRPIVLLPPRVIVRIVYAAHAPDMLRLAEAAAAVAAGRGGGYREQRQGHGSEGARGTAASVELLRSEVRAQQVDSSGGSATCTRQGGGRVGEGLVGAVGEEAGSLHMCGPALQLQVRTCVGVSFGRKGVDLEKLPALDMRQAAVDSGDILTRRTQWRIRRLGVQSFALLRR